MADIHHVVTLGLGTPADIPHFILFGLSPSGALASLPQVDETLTMSAQPARRVSALPVRSASSSQPVRRTEQLP